MSVRWTQLRLIADERIPRMARVYRRARDRYRASRYHPEPTGLGFSMLRGSEYANRLVGTELPTFKRHLETVDLVVDVGANVGFFALLASRAGVDTLAIEPSSLNLRHLYENLRLAKGPGSVEVLPVAISDAIGVTDLLGSGQGASLQPGWGGIAANYRTPVPTTTLDSVLAGRTGRLLIKVDVEGSENAVLAGASATLDRTPRPTWLIEHGPEVREGYEEFFELLWTRDYRVMALPEAAGKPPYWVDPAMVGAWALQEEAPELMFLCEHLSAESVIPPEAGPYR